MKNYTQTKIINTEQSQEVSSTGVSNLAHQQCRTDENNVKHDERKSNKIVYLIDIISIKKEKKEILKEIYITI